MKNGIPECLMYLANNGFSLFGLEVKYTSISKDKIYALKMNRFTVSTYVMYVYVDHFHRYSYYDGYNCRHVRIDMWFVAFGIDCD